MPIKYIKWWKKKKWELEQHDNGGVVVDSVGGESVCWKLKNKIFIQWTIKKFEEKIYL